MASVCSRFNIAGTYGNLVVYMVGSKLFARTKSSMDRKRFFKDPAFANSREKSKAFGVASTIAKEFYSTLPKEIKRHGLFGKITGFIQRAFHEGKSREVLIKELIVLYGNTALREQPYKIEKPKVTIQTVKPSPLTSYWQVTADGKLKLLQPLTMLRQKKACLLTLPVINQLLFTSNLLNRDYVLQLQKANYS